MMSPHFIKKYININDLLNEIFYDYNNLDQIDEDKFYEYKHFYIDNYVSLIMNNKNIKKLIDNFGFKNAIKLYEEEHGDFDISDNKTKNYAILAYNLIDDYINNNIEEINTNYLNI